MKSNVPYIKYTWFILIMVFIVILAGGVVRMTQSGMGCPDWPTCFGRWIPPLNEEQLPPDFEKYLGKQDIDHSFNVYHTWIEYTNRLLGAILGVFIFMHFIWTFRKFRKIDKKILGLSGLLLLAVAFQGWLGKEVVAHNLATVKVTIHMLVALFIAALPLLIIYKLKPAEKINDRFLIWFSTLLLVLVLVQVVLGTQVREQVDEISKPLKYQQRELWIAGLDDIFFIHRSFSWLLLICCLLLAWKAWKYLSLRNIIRLLMFFILSSILAGIIMAWYDIPALAQPLHLLLANALVMVIFTIRLRVKRDMA